LAAGLAPKGLEGPPSIGTLLDGRLMVAGSGRLGARLLRGARSV